MIKIKLTNTLTKNKEEFLTLNDGKVSLYACGVTPYDHSHIGHGRSYVFVDSLVRFLKFCDYNVTYVRNVTDIDDKLLVKGKAAGDVMLYKSIAEKFTKLYQEEMHVLNCLDPDKEPKVTENIDQIIHFIEKLIDAGKAYVVNSDVYFDITSYKSYGELSKKNIDDLQAGARVSVDTRKKNPADFALWKGNDEELFWKSPWGYGRPGWHIECSVMAKEFLGETIDIHCGGADLIFPHHENERAQSESLHNKTFARFWVHNALLNIDREKMSKSLGNILSLKEIFEKCDPMVLRFYFLQHHYRTPIEFSFEMLHAARSAYKKLVNCFGNSRSEKTELVKLSDLNTKKFPLVEELIESLADDLNTPKLLGLVFDKLSDLRNDGAQASVIKKILHDVLGLTLEPLKEESVKITPEISDLIEQRENARKEKNWALADQIRDQLTELGYKAQDKKTK